MGHRRLCFLIEDHLLHRVHYFPASARFFSSRRPLFAVDTPVNNGPKLARRISSLWGAVRGILSKTALAMFVVVACAARLKKFVVLLLFFYRMIELFFSCLGAFHRRGFYFSGETVRITAVESIMEGFVTFLFFVALIHSSIAGKRNEDITREGA